MLLSKELFSFKVWHLIAVLYNVITVGVLLVDYGLAAYVFVIGVVLGIVIVFRLEKEEKIKKLK